MSLPSQIQSSKEQDIEVLKDLIDNLKEKWGEDEIMGYLNFLHFQWSAEKEFSTCPLCKKEYKDKENQEAILNLNMCLSCDSIKAEEF
jgi:hypothetical protein